VCLGLVAATDAPAQAGHLDPSFGSGGVVLSTPISSFTGAAIAPNGDIVVAGSASTPTGPASSVATFVRYLPTGVPDPTFGSDGVVSLPPPSNFFLGESFPLAMAIQNDGKILMTYYAFNNTSTLSEALLIRLDANGQPDTTFGSGGQVTLSFPTPVGWGASATQVLQQPDGRILVTGNIVPPFRNHSAPLTLLARYLADGVLDTALGSGGVDEVVTAVDLPTSLALLTGDGILALNGQGTITTAQFTSTGSLVNPATGGTIAEIKNTGLTAFQSNGEHLIGGTVQGTEGRTNADAVVTRFLLNGTQDTGFQSPAIRFAPDAPSTKTIPAGVTVDLKGRVVVTAELEAASFGSGVARLNTNGTLNATFGNGGVGTLVPQFVTFAVLVQADNKIVMVSGTGQLARYLAQ
jgi:uncharacterized delta-60 repeat protein